MTVKRMLPVDTDLVEDMERIIYWKLRHQMGFVFEAEASAIEPLLPRGIYPMEPRPGVALVFIGFNDYHTSGNMIGGEEQPRFQEMTRCILVQPDLAIRMPIPRFTFFVHRIGSNNRRFVDQEIAQLRLPSYHSPTLTMDVNEAGTELHLRDQDGMIQHLRNTHPDPVYRNDAFFGQYYTVQDGKLYFGVWSWKGASAVHQRSGDAGRIFEHPFLTGTARKLGADRLGDAYQQLFSRPGDIVEQRFYAPRFVRNIEKDPNS